MLCLVHKVLRKLLNMHFFAPVFSIFNAYSQKYPINILFAVCAPSDLTFGNKQLMRSKMSVNFSSGKASDGNPPHTKIWVARS